MKSTYYAVNKAGLNEILEFLRKYHKNGKDIITVDMLKSWAGDVEFQTREGNPPTLEIASYDCVLGRTVDYTISDDGMDAYLVDNGEED